MITRVAGALYAREIVRGVGVDAMKDKVIDVRTTAMQAFD